MWSMRCEMGWPMAMAAGRCARRAADVGLHLGHAAAHLGRGLEAHVQLAHMHALGMLIELGTAAASAHMGDLGHLAHQALGLAGQRGGFGQRDAGVEPHADEQRAFVERRQEGGGKQRHRYGRQQHRHRAHRHGGTRVVQHALQGTAVARLEPGQQARVAVVQVLHARQQVKGQHRRDGDRHQQRG